MRVLLTLCFLFVALPSSAQAAYTIRVSHGVVTRIGNFKPYQSGTILAAEREFGFPTSLRANSDSCHVYWRRLGLRIVFANFGGTLPGQTNCSATVSFAQSFTARSRKFRTWKGLRPGAATNTIPVRHPAARFRQGSWWLRTATSVIGTGQPYPVLRATVGHGRVRALAGWIGAAGD
jgi:hypothetical protein